MTYSKRIDKNKLFRALMVFTITVFVLLKATTMTFSYVPSEQREYKTVVVGAGDSLWSIASEHTSGDIRQKVDDIRDFNNLKTDILSVGEHILIPIYD